jgi:hypothetical protein
MSACGVIRIVRNSGVVNTSASAIEPPPVPAPPELAARAEELVRKYNSQCFWFWGPHARVESREDVELVIRQLRDYGNHQAWKDAQQLRKCL